jgi:hypothetical protein
MVTLHEVDEQNRPSEETLRAEDVEDQELQSTKLRLEAELDKMVKKIELQKKNNRGSRLNSILHGNLNRMRSELQICG